MHVLTAVVGFVLVVGAFGLLSEDWSSGMQNERMEDHAVQPMGAISEVTEALDAIESDLGICACKGDACTCCYQRRYKVLSKKFIINVCSEVAWATNKFYLRMTFNKTLVYLAYVTNVYGVCIRFPMTISANACTEMHNVNLGRKSFCFYIYDRSKTRFVTHVNRCFQLTGNNSVSSPPTSWNKSSAMNSYY